MNDNLKKETSKEINKTLENLSKSMRENLSRLGYTNLTTIQEKVIPIALEGKDLIGQSRTGTGKTAAFLIPIIESLEANKGTQALVLAPTRELAIQIKEEGIKLSKEMDFNILAVYGGENIENQIYQLKRKAELVIGTPGRVLDHLQRKTLRLNALKFFVLDEVDEMLKRGFIDDIKVIAEKAKSEKLQTLFFSATISRETKSLADNFLKNPVFVNNSQKDNLIKPLISQYYLQINDSKNKLGTLIDIIHFQSPDLAIIFAGTKRMVDIISDELTAEGFLVDKIHSDLSQKKRTSVYNDFKNKKIKFLVATDIAARGIDVEGISHVYNYDFPQDPEFYIHRIGRTGRAGSTGQSVILLNNWEIRRQIPFLEKLTGEKIQSIYQPSQEEINEIIENNLLEKITKKIEDAENNKVTEKVSNLLNKYNAEQILKGMIGIFSVKRKKAVSMRNSDQDNRGGRRFETRRENYGRNRNKSNSSYQPRRGAWSFSDDRDNSSYGKRPQRSNNRYNKN